MQTATRRSPASRAFTLIELIAVIVVLAILSGVAIPKYFDYTTRAKESACKGTLGAVRSSVANYFANESLTGIAAYPSIDQLRVVGAVLQEPIPANPYNGSSAIRAGIWTDPTVAVPNPAQPVAGTEGWCYDAAKGRFWANSSGAGENAW